MRVVAPRVLPFTPREKHKTPVLWPAEGLSTGAPNTARLADSTIIVYSGKLTGSVSQAVLDRFPQPDTFLLFALLPFMC